MNITINHREDRGTLATLVGRLQDQAELAGVLNTLYEMHLPLLSVEYQNGDYRFQTAPASGPASKVVVYPNATIQYIEMTEKPKHDGVCPVH